MTTLVCSRVVSDSYSSVPVYLTGDSRIRNYMAVLTVGTVLSASP